VVPLRLLLFQLLAVVLMRTFVQPLQVDPFVLVRCWMSYPVMGLYPVSSGRV
jgi:hypothetical protein